MKISKAGIRLKVALLIALVMFLLHNSFWLWKWDARVPYLCGFMPFSFAYYIGYAFLATLAMALVITLSWPDPPPSLLEPADRDTEELKKR
ncbi:MAG: hypothetical protein GX883_09960 [Firmicutes bacterium]|nr:hypothetical protein [Bacillota bacterium]